MRTDRWLISGTISRSSYLKCGLLLFILKFILDRAVATLGFGRGWSLLDYLVPTESIGMFLLPETDRWFYGTMVAIAVPFVFVGTLLTLARLRDAELSQWLTVLFFVPIINLFLFLTLSIAPGRRRRATLIPEIEIENSSAPLPQAQHTTHGNPRPLVELEYGREPARTIWSTWGRRFPVNPAASTLVSAALSVAIFILLILFGVYVLRDYGWGLFIGMPFLLGMTSAIIHGLGMPRTLGQCVGVAMWSMLAAVAALFGLAIEGLGCIIMAAPLIVPLVAVGAGVGYAIQNRPFDRTSILRLLIAQVTLMPVLLGAERLAQLEAPLYEVTTVVEVDAPPQKVWENVVDFPLLPPPTDWLFRAGVAYPIRADIAGRGKGAIRECVFSTGAFIEPIEVWDEPNLLKFSVTSNPPAMKEWTFYQNVHPPHVDDFLVSRGGQFKLTPLPGGRTRLEGTTWYQHNLWPASYWRLWSDFIIHRIHRRVLNHVKALSEFKE